jgi:predicted permease
MGLLVLVLKMLVVPLIVLTLLKFFEAQELHHRVVLLESSMPPMVMSAVLAVRYGLDEGLAIASVMLGILLSFITVPVIMALL